MLCHTPGLCRQPGTPRLHPRGHDPPRSIQRARNRTHGGPARAHCRGGGRRWRRRGGAGRSGAGGGGAMSCMPHGKPARWRGWDGGGCGCSKSACLWPWPWRGSDCICCGVLSRRSAFAPGQLQRMQRLRWRVVMPLACSDGAPEPLRFVGDASVCVHMCIFIHMYICIHMYGHRW